MRFINLDTMAEESYIPSDTILCLGNFDGVHIGHRQLVDCALTIFSHLDGGNKKLLTGAWFFESSSYKHVDEIYSLDEKLQIFSELGLKYAIIADFNEMKSLSPDSFVNDIIKKECRCIHAICGENFRFGAKAAGNYESLRYLMNGNATVVPLLSTHQMGLDSNVVVSSTYIRSLLGNGEIKTANKLLGKPYSITEEVLHGKALGRTIGIPTINQLPTKKSLILKNGIYATLCTFDKKTYLGVTNIGNRPTVEDNGRKNIETHIIDFNGNCYEKSVKIEFIERIRDEMKFGSIEELKSQVQADILTAIKLLNNY